MRGGGGGGALCIRRRGRGGLLVLWGLLGGGVGSGGLGWRGLCRCGGDGEGAGGGRCGVVVVAVLVVVVVVVVVVVAVAGGGGEGAVLMGSRTYLRCGVWFDGYDIMVFFFFAVGEILFWWLNKRRGRFL